jgi:hypothetical protein
LREKGTGQSVKKLDFTLRGISRYCLSAVYWTDKYSAITYFYSDVGSSRIGPYYITYQELTNRIAIIFVSAGVFGTGVGQIAELIKL